MGQLEAFQSDGPVWTALLQSSSTAAEPLDGLGLARRVIGVVIVTHGRLAEELFLALVHVVGPQAAIARVCVAPDDDLDERRAEIATRITEVDGGHGIIVITDMFGGTPSNLAISLMSRDDMEVISGANLPMLVKLAKLRALLPLQDVSERIQEAGRKYIGAASQAFPMCRARAQRG